DLLARLGLGVPRRERLDVGGVDRAVALGPEQVLQEHLQRERQPFDVKALLESVEAKHLKLAPADRQRVLGAKTVLRHGHLPCNSCSTVTASSLAESRPWTPPGPWPCGRPRRP